MLRALHACLDELPDDARALLLDYYRDAKSKKVTRRRQLAKAQGISLTILRSRVHRLRKLLERRICELT